MRERPVCFRKAVSYNRFSGAPQIRLEHTLCVAVASHDQETNVRSRRRVRVARLCEGHGRKRSCDEGPREVRRPSPLKVVRLVATKHPQNAPAQAEAREPAKRPQSRDSVVRDALAPVEVDGAEGRLAR